MESIEDRYLEVVIEILRNKNNSFAQDCMLAHNILQAEAHLKKTYPGFDHLDMETKIDVVSQMTKWKTKIM